MAHAGCVGLGAGKSKRVREECAYAGLSLWVSPIGTRGSWFDGYDHHDCALFDDFTGDMPFRSLLQLLEGNKVQVPVKGGFTTFDPKVVFFTSDRHPLDWCFPDESGHYSGQRSPLNYIQAAQLFRRFTHTERVEKEGEEFTNWDGIFSAWRRITIGHQPPPARGEAAGASNTNNEPPVRDAPAAYDNMWTPPPLEEPFFFEDFLSDYQ